LQILPLLRLLLEITRLAKDAVELHLGAALALALVGGLHEGVDLDGLLGANRALAGAEALDDVHHQRPVAVGRTDRALALVAPGRAAVALALAEDADAAVLPLAGDADLAVLAGPLDRLAPRTHDREQRLDAVDAVPEQ